MKGHGIPWVYVSGHIFLRQFRFKFPPDWWWRRYFRRGRCAYDNSMCPNDCTEEIMLDTWGRQSR